MQVFCYFQGTSKFFFTKKLVVPSLLAVGLGGQSNQHNSFFVTADIFSELGRRNVQSQEFLIDTGSSCSLLPLSFVCSEASTFRLKAANGTIVNTRGSTTLSFTLPGFETLFTWTFCVADVTCAILGIDFLGSYNLVLNCSNKSLSFSNFVESSCSSLEPICKPSQFNPISFIEDKLKSLPYLLKRNPDSSDIVSAYSHTICLENSLPLRERVRPLSPEKTVFLKEEIQILTRNGVIRPSKSPWASPIHIVTKSDNSYRLCGDYRRLNNITIHDAYPMPLINDVLTRLNTAKIFSTVDLAKAYHQIPVLPSDIEKTAIITPVGLYEYLRMPFGLRNASQTFQRHINNILMSMDTVVVYIDDIIIGSDNLESHKRDLEILFKRLSDNNLQINRQKCHFFQTEVKFLGHLVSASGIRPLPQRLESIRDFIRPVTVTNLRSFLGVINYCHRFIPHISSILAPLSAISRGPKRSKVIWDKATSAAFENAKKALLGVQTLAFPKAGLHLTLTTDASNNAIGGFLCQIEEDGPHPLEFFSKKLLESQSRYSTFDRELLGIFLSVKHFRHLVEGRELTIFTDHKPLTYLTTMKDPSPRQQKQICYITEFTSDIQHVAGKDNIVADYLSRSCAILFDPMFDNTVLRSNPPEDSDLTFFQGKLEIIDGVYIDISLPGTQRPIIGSQLRKLAFESIHNLHHPGGSNTYEMLRMKVIWPGMRSDVKKWTAECQGCQKNKITRHVKPTLMHFPTGNRFDIIHVDLVGPLPVDQGYTHLLTIIDRKTRWFEVIPLKTINADAVTNKIISEWIARYGVPNTMITDRGGQFESQIFGKISSQLGIKHHRTTSYHPQANGLVERFHRTLKQSLRILSIEHSWLKVLPFVLLGWRNTPSRATESSPAQMLFGTNTALPNELVNFARKPSLEELAKARDHFLSLDTNPLFSAANNQKSFLPDSLKSATHVWIRQVNESNLRPLYNGPFPLISIVGNYAVVTINNVAQTVSLSRIKPALGIDMKISTDPDISDFPDIPHDPDQATNFQQEEDEVTEDPEILQSPPVPTMPIAMPRKSLSSRRDEFFSSDAPAYNTRSKRKVRFSPWIRETTIGDDPLAPTRLRRL